MSPIDAQRVLVPVDFLASDSNAAVELATTLMKVTGGDLSLLHVLAPMGSMSGIVPGARDEQDLALLRENARETLELWAQSLRAQGIERVSVHVEVGQPVERILDHARAEGIELIVMGTHGRTGLRRLLIGSVAEMILRHAACRVVVVRTPPSGPGSQT